MYQHEHNELFASIRNGKPINDGDWMAQEHAARHHGPHGLLHRPDDHVGPGAELDGKLDAAATVIGGARAAGVPAECAAWRDAACANLVVEIQSCYRARPQAMSNRVRRHARWTPNDKPRSSPCPAAAASSSPTTTRRAPSCSKPTSPAADYDIETATDGEETLRKVKLIGSPT